MERYRITLTFENGNEIHAAVEAETALEAVRLFVQRVGENEQHIGGKIAAVAGDGCITSIHIDTAADDDPAIAAARRNSVFFN